MCAPGECWRVAVRESWCARRPGTRPLSSRDSWTVSLDKSALATLLFTTLVAVLVSRVSWTAGAAEAKRAQTSGPAEAERRRTTGSTGVGVMLGLLTLTRENALLLALPIVVWLSSGHGSRRERLRRAIRSSSA